MTILEVNTHLIDKAKQGIKKSLQRVARKKHKDDDDAQLQFVQNALTRIKGSTDLKSTVKGTDLVIEAIVENIKVKQDLFTKLDEVYFILLLSTELYC